MENPKKVAYANQAAAIIKKLNARQMEGYYCEDVAAAKAKLLELIGGGKKSVAYGGSMTIDENGFKAAVTEAGHELRQNRLMRTAFCLAQMQLLWTENL